MKIYDRTNIPNEEKIFIKNVLNEINDLKKKHHKHNKSLVLEFNDINKEGMIFQINSTAREISQNKSVLTKRGITEPITSKLVLHLALCASEIIWNACEIKFINEETYMIGIRGKSLNQRADMVAFVSKKEFTTEVNQLIEEDKGIHKIRTRIISEFSTGVLEVEEIISSSENGGTLYKRHSFLDIPEINTKIAIIEKHIDEITKKVFYEKYYGTPQAKGYDLQYDNTHVLPEDALRYIMRGDFNSIALPPSFLKDTKLGQMYLEKRKKTNHKVVTVKNNDKRPVSQKKQSSGALEIDKLLANARNNIEKK